VETRSPRTDHASHVIRVIGLFNSLAARELVPLTECIGPAAEPTSRAAPCPDAGGLQKWFARTLNDAARRQIRHGAEGRADELVPHGHRASEQRQARLPSGGDNVAAISAWAAETLRSRLTPADCNTALDAIAAGPEPGARYAAQRRGRGTERWVGRMLTDPLQVNETQAVEVIGAWLISGLLIEENYRDSLRRKTRVGVVDATRPTACRADAQAGFNSYNKANEP
jgi:hypothetical protein